MKLIDKDKVILMLQDKITNIKLDMKCGFLEKRKGNEKILVLKHIISLITDAIEVKDVDLDGISRQYALNNTPWDDCVDEIQDAYKAGFELGLKAQKNSELTQKDISIIYGLVIDAVYEQMRCKNPSFEGKDIYQEVLKRFKTQKGE